VKSPALHITKHVRIKGDKILLNGEIVFQSESINLSDFLASAYRNTGLNYPKYFKMDNLAKASILAAHYILNDIEQEIQTKSERISICLSNSSSSLDTDLKHLKSVEDPSNFFPSPAVFVYTLPNIGLGEICIKYKIMGENCFYVFEKFNAAFLTQKIHISFADENTEMMLAGWVELFENDIDILLFLTEKSEKGLPLETEIIENLYTQF